MPIYRGTDLYLPFKLLRKVNSDPVNISSWDIEAHFRTSPDDADAILETSLSGGQWTVTDGENGNLTFALTAAETAVLPLGILLGDVMRIDGSNRIRLFGINIPVVEPLTR